jgi:NAD(P)H-quinone oxidoreductase subunit 5
VQLGLLVLVGAPALGALAGSIVRRRAGGRWVGALAVVGAWMSFAASAALFVVIVAGGSPRVGPSAAPWLRLDSLGITLSLVVALIGATVLSYARRYLDPGRDGIRFALAAGLLLTTTQSMASAGRLSVLVAGWIGTSVLVVALIHDRRQQPRREAARRAAVALGLGDGALLVATGLMLWMVGDVGLDRVPELARALQERAIDLAGVATIDAATVVGLLLATAALARAAQMPFPCWLPGTLAAPTPTSALLHAGVVNAGGFLLVRMIELLGVALPATMVLAACSIATIGVWAGAMLARPDVKGSLAASTSAQMGFMLVAVAVGAPAAAMAHLVGHALYKSTRFLGAGDAIRVGTRRRRLQAHERRSLVLQLASTLAMTLVILGGVVLIRPAVLSGPDGWMVGAALTATAVGGAWGWSGTGRRSPVASPLVGGAILAVAVSGYLVLVTAMKGFLALLPDTSDGFVSAVLVVAVLAALALTGLLGTRHPWVSRRLWIAFAGTGRPPIAVVRSSA